MNERTRGAVVLNVPRRFEVGFSTIDGVESTYKVVTWFGRDKAVAWAASVHRHDYPDLRIYSVTVFEDGEPPLTKDRGYDLDPDSYTDRNEW